MNKKGVKIRYKRMYGNIILYEVRGRKTGGKENG